MSDDLENRRVLVIGGTHGMGRATAELLSSRGAEVTVTGSGEENLRRAVSETPKLQPLRLDLANDDDIDALPALLGSRPFDAVLVFAGLARLAPLAEVTREDFDRQFSINVRGLLFALQHIAPLIANGGAIVLTTVTPATATPTMGVYLASKAAVAELGRVLAAELLQRGIRVNLLAPGFIDTPTHGVAGLTEQERAEFHAIGDSVTPMGRHGSMNEIAAAAAFLAFDATFSTGIELPVDGGLSSIDAPA